MRILHLVPGLMLGGQETMLINIANVQVKEHEVIVLIVNKDYDNELVRLFSPSVRIVCADRPRSSKNPWFLLKLNLLIYKLRPDVVHSHYEKLVLYLVKLGYKFVYTIHGFTIPPKYLKANRNLVAISKGIKKDVKERAHVDSTVIYNGIKVEDIKQKNKLHSYKANRPFRIIQVSRLYHEVKGQDVLIKAVAILKNKGYTNIIVDFIGEGASYEFLRELAKCNGLTDVNFLGAKPVDYIKTNLCDYDLFVQASRHEGFGLTVAEAMAAKVPLLVSECDGLLEVVDEGKYSLVFEKGSVADCAAKIEELITSDIEKLQQRVEDAWNYVNDNFNVTKTADRYIQYYEQCE